MIRSRCLVLGALGAAALGGGDTTAGKATRRTAVVGVAREGAPSGLLFRLSEGQEEAEAPARVAVAPATALGEAEARRVLDRLPPFAEKPETQDFALREPSLPPPRPGRTVTEAFPPAAAAVEPPEVGAGPLEVLRHAPEGEVPLAPYLSVTFSQPMVAVTSRQELERESAPVRLQPEPPGRWRWVGAKTLLFEPAARFPMATDYRVEVPAGTRSARGATLEKAAAWTFSTPPPTLTSFHPAGGPARRDPLLFAAFDQKVDPQAVIGTIQLRAEGAGTGAAMPQLRLATHAEVEADPDVRVLAERTQAGRWLAFRPEAPLPPGAAVTVEVEPGAPSAEGPRTTAKAQTWRFRTYGPLRVTSHRCAWGGPCPPFAPWQVELSNPIDAGAFRAAMVGVEPPLPGMKVDVYGSSLQIRGRSTGRTTYQVTLDAAVPDVFGQTLGASAPLAFAVGPALPSLQAPGGPFVVLDPAAGPRFSVYTVNHDALKLRAWAVEPSDWPAFQKYMQESWRDDRVVEPPGRRVLATTVPVAGRPDELTETRLDLSPALRGGLGQLVLVVEPASPPKEGSRWTRVQAWIQATRIGLDAFADGGRLVAWASSLQDGRPLAGVTVSVSPGGAIATTGEDGLATLPLPAAAGPVLVARGGKDVALLPQSLSWWSSETGWRRREAGEALRFYVFDDRRLYRPGEEVRVKGWIRRLGLGATGDLGPLAGAAHTVAFVLRDSQGNEIARGTRDVEGLGGFDLALKLPPTMNLGTASLDLEADAPGLAQRSYRHTFEVQEFRRPEFEVTAAASEGPHLVGGHATATVSAAYYAGGALPGAELTWRVTASPAGFTPPNRGGFTFGTWVPWWEPVRAEAPRVETFSARTDASGRHRLRIDFDGVEPERPTSLLAEATVVDVNRQAWTAGTRLLVHPASLYVGLRSGRLFVAQGEPLLVEAIVVDLDGRAVAGRPIALLAERLDWEQEGGEWKEKAVDAEDCRLTSAGEPQPCRFATKEGGAYRVTATVTDDAGRRNQSQLRLWVAGGRMPPRRSVEQESLTLVPDKKEYRAGETAEVLVMAPFFPAEGLLTLRRSGLLRTERFTMSGPSHTLRARIEEGWTPDVHLQVDLVGETARADAEGRPDQRLPKRPAFATGNLDLSVPPLARTLGLEVTPRERALPPGGSTVLDLRLGDSAGRPVAGGEVAVVVVDEAVLALTGYRLPDPLRVFYAPREGGVEDHHLRASVLLGRPEDVALDETDALGALGGAQDSVRLGGVLPAAAPAAALRMKAGALEKKEEATPIRMRSDFQALALFAARLPTDVEGRAQVKVTLPDSLTRYRVMAVAAAGGTQFGSGESTLTARLPLMVRPSPPRFLNFGDRFELPVVLQNQTDGPLSVEVAARAANADLAGPPGWRLTVPANDRVEVRFPAAARQAGAARFQVGAVSGAAADAAFFQLPVWTPATTEAFATYGRIDEGAVAQPVRAPGDAVPGFGGLEITTSSTALQALTDAVLYLVAYPFECAEQLSSRVLAVAALKDVLGAFRAEGLPGSEELVAAVGRDLERLRSLQNDDGGFGFWRHSDDSWPYVGIHVAHALQRAKEKGFAVPPEMLDRSRAYLREIERHIPKWYGDDARRTLVAYALYVRQRLGDADPGRARALVREEHPERLSFEAMGWLLNVLSRDPGSAAEAAALRRHLANRVTETAATAHFAVSYGDEAHLLLYSDRRADAIVLEALIGDQPGSDLIPKLVEGLLAHRRAGRWENTQENAFVLLALDRYFATYEKTTPDFVARAWLGGRYAGEHAFRGRTTERQYVEIPMRALAAAGATELVLAKEGAGRLYYRIGIRYAPSGLRLEPADQGFTVERAYEGVDQGSDVRREGDGSWHVRAGARVRVRLTMVATAQRYHVALVDPLPAGLEPLNPALAVTGTIPPGPSEEVAVVGAPGLGGPGRPGMWWWWTRPWFEHQNMRDERVEAFASLLWEGVYTYSYVARATTPGIFVVPPPKAEEMYHPETFGRGASDRVVVE